MERLVGALVICLVAAFLVIASSGAPVDTVAAGETDVLELAPAPATEGIYTRIDDRGEVEIVLTERNPNVDGDGVNPSAVTDVGPVLIVRNILERNTTADVWIEHDGEAVEFYADRCGTCIDRRSAAVRLPPGESVTVGLRVDTRGVDDEVLLGAVTVKAQLYPPIGTDSAAPDGSTRTSSSSSTPAGTPSSAISPTATTTITETPSSTTQGGSPGTADRSDAEDGQGEDLTTTPPDAQREQAGLDSWSLGVMAAVVIVVGSGLLLARRFEYI